MLRIAIQTKGRLNEQSIELLHELGIDVDAAKRKFLSKASNFPIEVLYLRDDDIPQVVANSENTLAVNIGADNIGDRAPQLLLEGGSVVAINVLRFNGVSCEYTEGTSVRLYSRLGINERREDTLIVN